MKGLLSVERMVLESVFKGNCTISGISLDSGLSEMFVRTLLGNLKDYGLISYRKGQVEIAKNSEHFKVINKKENLSIELKELFSSLVDNYYGKGNDVELKMQKIWLTDYEEKILKSMMQNIDNFIKSIRKDRLLRPEEEILAEQKVIFWGLDSYSSLIGRHLKAA